MNNINKKKQVEANWAREQNAAQTSMRKTKPVMRIKIKEFN